MADNNIDVLIKEAERRAVKQGYDQMIFVTKRGVPAIERIANIPQKNPKYVIMYIRLTYKDGELKTRNKEGEYDVKRGKIKQAV